MIFSNVHEADAFRETWCDRCYQPDQATLRITGKGPGCPLLQAASAGALPTQWTRRRQATMGSTYRCSEFTKHPPVTCKGSMPEIPQEGMFEIPEPSDRLLIPIEGWPDYHVYQKKAGEVDHQ